MLQWIVCLVLGSLLVGFGGGVLSTGFCLKWDDKFREHIDWLGTASYVVIIIAGFGLVALGYIDNPLFS